MINITNNEKKIIQEIFQTNIPNVEVRVFGSRIRNDYRKTSDIDFAIFAKEKIDYGVFAKLQMDFSDSDLPFQVDVVDTKRTSPEFIKLINKEYEIFPI